MQLSIFLFYAKNTNRTQSGLPEIAKAKFLLCNDSASRNQKKFTYFGEAQPILCKFTVICEDNQINKKLFTDVFLLVSLICINKTG